MVHESHAVRFDDPLHYDSPPDRHWTRANIAEALPGVLTPLGFSVWSLAGEGGVRRGLHDVGVYSRAESIRPPDPADRMLQVFHARPAARVDMFSAIGDRMPGTTGAEVLETVFGGTPENFTFRPTRRRYPVLVWRLPSRLLLNPRRLHAARREVDVWWRASLREAGSWDHPTSVAMFERGVARFGDNIGLQASTLFACVQPTFDLLTRVSERAGCGNASALTGGYGGVPEADVVNDMWAASRDEIPVEQVVARHGYHGPWEGEISGRVWREDPKPLRRMIEEYAARQDSADPRLFGPERRSRREQLERELIAATPASRRPAVRALLVLARTMIPLRGEAKMAFLQSLDVARMAARRVGEHLARKGDLAEAEDVFYLTRDELTGHLPSHAGEVVAWRRARRAEHATVDVPVHWTGMPMPMHCSGGAGLQVGETIEAMGVSPGIVEGRVRVVTDPTFDEVEPDEILVASTTDPSWSSIMFISSALVMDTGGALSHAAVVARELGVPCVVNTTDGSRRLRTGDRVRVDGSAGTVELLARTS